MTDSAGTVHECAVCGGPATAVCGGCRDPFFSFCSKEHQKLIWPAHRYICSREAAHDAFYLGPLVAEEFEVAEKCLEQGNLVVDAAVGQSRRDGVWSEMREMLGSLSKPNWEPRRSLLIAALRMEMLRKSIHRLPQAFDPWICLSAFQEALTGEPTHPILAYPVDLFRNLNLLYRRVFIRWALFSSCRAPHLKPLAEAAIGRQYAALAELNLPQEAKDKVKMELDNNEKLLGVLLQGKEQLRGSFGRGNGLGELATFLPHKKGFSGYATRFVDPVMTFALGWNYLMKYLVVTPDNVVAATFVKVFGYFVSLVTTFGALTWMSILWSHIRFTEVSAPFNLDSARSNRSRRLRCVSRLLFAVILHTRSSLLFSFSDFCAHQSLEPAVRQKASAAD
ncbi:hypothetical protein JCM6882_001993 [Rhodosporidiobolus microsporus]